MDTNRLGKLLRMVLGAATDGEQLAAIAAFHRAMEAEGLDLHDISERFERGGAAPRPAPADDNGENLAWLSGDRAFRAACDLARQYSDDLWPDLAQWLLDQDNTWHAGHDRWLLRGLERRFVEQMAEESQSVRPSLRQCGWLIVLFNKVSVQRARPEPAPPEPIGARPGPSRPARVRQVPPPRRKPQPRRVIGRPDQLRWIAAILAARRLGARPVEDAEGSALFSDAEARALVWLGANIEAWVIDRSARGKDVLRIDLHWRHGRPSEAKERRVAGPHSAAEIAAHAQISLRTVRRALAKAKTAGWLAVERPGIGRGRRTAYQLTLPAERQRHNRIPAGQPRRQAARPPTVAGDDLVEAAGAAP